MNEQIRRKRRLTAILVADVVGYSSLMESDEEGTATRMAACRAIAEPGAIDLSGAMFEQIRRTSPYAFDDRSQQRFRNISERVRVFRLRGEMRRHPCQITHTQSTPDRPSGHNHSP